MFQFQLFVEYSENEMKSWQNFWQKYYHVKI